MKLNEIQFYDSNYIPILEQKVLEYLKIGYKNYGISNFDNTPSYEKGIHGLYIPARKEQSNVIVDAYSIEVVRYITQLSLEKAINIALEDEKEILKQLKKCFPETREPKHYMISGKSGVLMGDILEEIEMEFAIHRGALNILRENKN